MVNRSYRFAFMAAALLASTGCEGALDEIGDLLSSNLMYSPSSSMEPTIPLQARFRVYETDAASVKRGEVYIVQPNLNDPRVVRLIGLPGDTIEMRSGTVILNGEALRQEDLGEYEFNTQYEGVKTGQRLREYLPGDAVGHEVLNLGASTFDDFGPVKLPQGRYFFLGDNRDNSADSRLSQGIDAGDGLGLVEAEAITHRVDLDSVSS